MQVQCRGIPVEVTTEEEVTEAIISKVHNKRYVMANCAPICQELFIQDSGHMSVTDGAPQSVLEGRYYHPKLDKATKDLFQEIASTQSIIPANSTSTAISQQDWQAYWTQADKWTLSLESGLHFEHYKAAISLEYISPYHAAKTTVAKTLGQPMDRWKQGVTVLLEKERGVNLISKMRAILQCYIPSGNMH